MIRFSAGYICGILTAAAITLSTAYAVSQAQGTIASLNRINQFREWIK